MTVSGYQPNEPGLASEARLPANANARVGETEVLVADTGVVDRLGASGRSNVGRRLAEASVVYNIPETNVVISEDGTLHARTPDLGGPLALLTELALQQGDGRGPFAGVGDVDLLNKVAEKLLTTHPRLCGEAPDVGTQFAWRQARGAALSLAEQAMVRVYELGGVAAAEPVAGGLLDAIAREPCRMLRDFAYERLNTLAEADSLPAIEAAREALYPSAPPYEKWMENGQVDVVLYCDDDGAKIADEIAWLVDELGAQDVVQPDGSHRLTVAGIGGRPPVVVTIPAKGSGEPKLFHKMNDPSVDVIAYSGHAGYGHRVDRAVKDGVGGTGEGKAVVLFQCSGDGSATSLERTYPDAQLFSTTSFTHGGFDGIMWFHLIRGWQNGDSWPDMHARGLENLKEVWSDDAEYKDKDWEAHYFNPTTRSVLVKRVDRDGDGKTDTQDHVFNVIYPKRVDAAGGYDPVVQPMPIYALDGTEFGKAMNDLSLALRYTQMLPDDVHAKLPWNPDSWQPSGFFEPSDADLRAFQFERTAAGGVDVKLSARFTHTQQEDLSRMLAYEAGLWLGQRAGVDAVDQAALALALTDRVVHAQGAWYGTKGMLDEPWAEEAMFAQRYGIDGLRFDALEAVAGNVDDYTPEVFAKVRDVVAQLPSVEALAARDARRVGKPITLPTDPPPQLSAVSGDYVRKADVAKVLSQLGIDDRLTAWQPRYLRQNQPTNVVATCRLQDGSHGIVSLGVDKDGLVHAAATLPFDLQRQVQSMCLRVLDGLGEAVPARTSFEAALALGLDPMAALAEALVNLRPDLPVGQRPAEGQSAFIKLVENGFVDRQEVRELERVIARYYGGAKAEEVVFGWLESAMQNTKAVAALKADYLAKLVAAEGGAKGRTEAFRAVVEALPQGVGLGTASLASLRKAIASAIPGRSSAAELYGVILQRAGVSRADQAAAAVAELLDGPTSHTAAAQAGEAAEYVRNQIAAGGDLAQAVEYALVRVAPAAADAYRRQAAEQFWVDCGLVALDSDEASALQQVMSRARERASVIRALTREVASAAHVPDAENRSRFFGFLALADNDLVKGVTDYLAAVRSELGSRLPVEELTELLRVFPVETRAEVGQAWLHALGHSPISLLRAEFARSRGVDQALAAFDRVVAAGGGSAEAAQAFFSADGAPSASRKKAALNFLEELGSISSAEFAELRG